MAWRTRRGRGAFCHGRFATDSAAELLKFLLAGTGLPRVYRTLDRRRRRHCRHRLSELDARTQEAVRLFISSLDTGALPPMSRAILYGSRARGDHRDDSDVDIMLVFAGDRAGLRYAGTRCATRWRPHMPPGHQPAMTPGVDVASLCTWADEPDESDVRFNPEHYRYVLADGVDVTFLQTKADSKT